jgi:hypothetical protein
LEVLKEWFAGQREGAYLKLVRIIGLERSKRQLPEGSREQLLERLLGGAVIDSEELGAAFADAATTLANLRAGRNR